MQNNSSQNLSKKTFNNNGFTHCGGALGQHWPSEMTHHSKLVIHNDPNNLSHLNSDAKTKINEIQLQIDDLKSKRQVKKVLSAFDIFENKHFNSFKGKYPHNSSEELRELIVSKWENQLTQDERDEYTAQSKEMQLKYH